MLDPPPTREKCFGVHILSPSLNQQIFPDVEILSKCYRYQEALSVMV